VQRKEFVSVEPDKSLMRKIARGGYSLPECLAELIDNSIDSILEGIEHGRFASGKIHVQVPLRGTCVSVRDDGLGMTEEEARRCLVLGASAKRNALGMYGLGLKGAGIALGGRLSITTTHIDSETEFEIVYDDEEWKVTPGWAVPFIARPKSPTIAHGTLVRIEKLRRRAYAQTEISHLARDLGSRYSPFLIDGLVRIVVNGQECKAVPPELMEGPEDLRIPTAYGEIAGWFGFLKRGSNVGAYGFDTYFRKRMVTQYDKSFFVSHPTLSRLVGVLRMDFVPPQTTKRGWDNSSPEYEAAKQAILEHLRREGILRRARELSAISKLTRSTELRKEELLDCMEKALKTPEVMSLFPEEPPSAGREGVPSDMVVRDGPTVKRRVEIEKRDPGDSTGTVIPLEEPTRTRTPKKVQLAERSIRLGRRTYRFTHEWAQLGVGAGRKDWNLDGQTLAVCSNLEHPAFDCTTDHSFYAAEDVAESLAEFICQRDAEWMRVVDLRDTLLRKAAEIQTGLKDGVPTEG